MVGTRELVFGIIVGYKSETEPIDFGVNGYIFKVKVKFCHCGVLCICTYIFDIRDGAY